jgi:signal transduction histidine kinase
MLSFVRACAFLFAVIPIALAADDSAPLATLRELSEISREEADRRRPVHVSCVVTSAEPDWNTLIVQDGEWSAFVELDDQTVLPGKLAVGDQIELAGSTRAGRDRPSIHADEILSRGPGQLPHPVPVSGIADTAIDHWNRFVVFDGVVYASHTDDCHTYLSVSAPELAMYVVVRYSGVPPVKDWWRGKIVRVRGSLAVPESGLFATTILASRDQVELLTSPEGRSEELRFQQLGSLRTNRVLNRQPAELYRVIAQAISDSRLTDLVLHDSSGSVLISADELPEIGVGDVVVVTGEVTGQRANGLRVLEGDVRRVGPGLPLKAVEVPVDKAVEHPFEYVCVTAAFRGFAKADGKRLPVFTGPDGGIFTVSGGADGPGVFNQLTDRSTVQIVGVCWPRPDDAYDFELIADRVEVLYEPPKSSTEASSGGLTAAALSVPGRGSIGLPSGPGSIGPLIVTAVALLLMLVFLVAFLVLLRRTREQRKFYETIHEQLNEVSHVSRLNTLAEMVGALAHELNQPLASVTNFAETARLLSQQSGASSPQLESLLQRVSAESLRAGEIIRRLRSLASRKTPGQVPTSLNQVVSDSLDMFRMQELVANGTLETHLEENLPRIEVDPIQLQQVILNLLLNARDAIAQLDGRLPRIIVRTGRSGDWLTVTIDDNGAGITSDDPSAIFEPYFTTKSDGMGLGLAICRTIVESHNGKLSAENLTPHGARLSVSLPLGASQRLPASPEDSATSTSAT